MYDSVRLGGEACFCASRIIQILMLVNNATNACKKMFFPYESMFTLFHFYAAIISTTIEYLCSCYTTSYVTLDMICTMVYWNVKFSIILNKILTGRSRRHKKLWTFQPLTVWLLSIFQKNRNLVNIFRTIDFEIFKLEIWKRFMAKCFMHSTIKKDCKLMMKTKVIFQ